MSTPSIIVGRGNWGVKTGNLLGYALVDSLYLPRDLTCSRAGNTATRVNRNGYIEVVNANVPRIDYFGGQASLLVEPSAENLARQSQDFTTTWTAVNTTPTANQTTSPDNTLTADRISITSNGGYIRQLLATSNSTTYTASCFVKNDAVASGDTFRFYFNNNIGAPNAALANATININAGTVLAGSSGGGISSVSAGIENYGNGWYRVRITLTLGASAGNASSEIGFEALTATRTFFAWGAQLEVGSIATSYIPTTTAPITRGADLVSKTGVSSLIGQTEGTIYAEVDIRNMAKETYTLEVDDGVNANRIIIRSLTSNQMRGSIVATTSSGTIGISSATFTSGIVKIAFAYKSGDFALSVNGAAALTASGTFTFGASLNRITLGSVGGGGIQLNDRIRAAEIYPIRLPNVAPPGVLSLQSLTAV